jgi:hypothetical protein
MLLFTSLHDAAGGFVAPDGGEDPIFEDYGDGDGATQCGSTRAWQANDMMAQQYQVPSTGLVVSVSAWLSSLSGNMRMGLYADSAGVPGALLAEPAPKAVTGPSHWQEFAFDPADYLAVTASDLVWICVQTDANINSCTPGSAVALARRIKSAAYASGLLDPFGAASTYSANRPLRLKIWTNP